LTTLVYVECSLAAANFCGHSSSNNREATAAAAAEAVGTVTAGGLMLLPMV